MIPDLSSKEVRKQLEEVYGYTEDFYRGGYILPDGKILDTHPNQTSHRCHDTVEGIGLCKKAEFIQAGAIRHVIGHNYFEMRNCPTEEQAAVLAKMIKFFEGRVMIDLWAGENMTPFRYQATYPGTVLRDIREFYLKG